jgi:hypothetical protein
VLSSPVFIIRGVLVNVACCGACVGVLGGGITGAAGAAGAAVVSRVSACLLTVFNRCAIVQVCE